MKTILKIIYFFTFDFAIFYLALLTLVILPIFIGCCNIYFRPCLGGPYYRVFATMPLFPSIPFEAPVMGKWWVISQFILKVLSNIYEREL